MATSTRPLFKMHLFTAVKLQTSQQIEFKRATKTKNRAFYDNAKNL